MNRCDDGDNGCGVVDQQHPSWRMWATACTDGALARSSRSRRTIPATEQVRAGVLTETDAKSHPWRHVVTRALSGGEDPDIEITDVEIRPGDRLLICSDGLSGVVPLDRISEILGRMDPLEATCRALVDAANQAGGPDNITVAVLQVEPA